MPSHIIGNIHGSIDPKVNGGVIIIMESIAHAPSTGDLAAIFLNDFIQIKWGEFMIFAGSDRRSILFASVHF